MPPALLPLRPNQAVATQQTGEFLIRQPVKSLSFTINSDYALSDQHELHWQLSATPTGRAIGTTDARELTGKLKNVGQEWQVMLPAVNWRRGEYRMCVALHAAAECLS